jgi:flavodoxin
VHTHVNAPPRYIEGYINRTNLFQIMNTCVVYFSRTGNTKRLAQAIADTAKAPIYDLASVPPSTVQNCDLLILGTPVEGSNPTKEAMSFIEGMEKMEGKKAILFVTYRAFGNERTMKKMEKTLESKGYKTVLKVSKKGMKPDKEADFSDILLKVKETMEKQ